MAKNRPNVVHYDTNTAGRDFCVGDLHGCYDDLLQALTLLEFDGQVDRLFSVGDLVDRGPDSMKCANLVFEDWFHCVKGNHEELFFETIINGSVGHKMTWIGNGGAWNFSEDPNELKAVARRLQELPFIITVGEGENRFNLVHAELKARDDNGRRRLVTDQTIDLWTFKDGEKDDMLWGRTMINSGQEKIEDCNPSDFYHDMEKLSLTFVGHTPVRSVVQVQKQMYIDTGAVYYHKNKSSEQHVMTIACPGEKTLYNYNMMWKTITKTSFEDVPKMG